MSLTPTTRASLLLRLRDHQDREAWLEFVTLYEPVIFRVLRRTGIQDADAVDILQELLLTVSRNIERWEHGAEHGSFRGWLRTATRNLVVCWIRKKRRELPCSPIDLDSLLESQPGNDCPEAEQFDHELRRAYFHQASEQVRNEVRPQTWQAFWEVSILGKPAVDVANLLGMTVGGVRVAKCRVVARLRAVVAELETPT